ncbi:MAG: purine-nucleoside phosphorylase, partial [Anaerolineae bacterium]|nr:purine-nucleoside phosphorylase [Anaerolineae bacterium]
MNYSREDYEAAAAVIRQRIPALPLIGLVLGSGLGALADLVEQPTVIPYEDLPGWPLSTVHGHSGRLVIGTLEGHTILVQQGRAHFYEGYTMQQVTFPVRVMHALGIKTLLLTNAAGGLEPTYHAGELMVLKDHINLPGLAGLHPLIGPNDEQVGPRFPGMAQTYDRHLRETARSVAQAHNIPLREGVYLAVAGP